MTVARADRTSPLRVGVLISGGGTTLKNLIDKSTAEQLDIEFCLVVSSHPDARGLEYSRNAGIDTKVLPREPFASTQAYSDAMFDLCRAADIELAVMAGFLKHVFIPEDFQLRVMNIHPSLIPAFCGHGFYGQRVHEAVLAQGVKISGCTVHFVDNEYDHGPIILQRSVAVADDDTPESLAARIFGQECEAFPEAIRLYAANRLRVVGARVLVN